MERFFSHHVLSLPLKPKYSPAAVSAATATTWSSPHHSSSALSRCDSCQQSNRMLKAPSFFVQARITVFIHGCSLLWGVGAQVQGYAELRYAYINKSQALNNIRSYVLSHFFESLLGQMSVEVLFLFLFLFVLFKNAGRLV